MCSYNNQMPLCCSMSDNRKNCSEMYSNCSSSFEGMGVQQYFSCPYFTDSCGSVQAVSASDPMFDSRFANNFIASKATP